jgi:predicted transcriptional regulator
MAKNVTLPDDLVEEIDRIAGARKRSRFVEEAVRERLRREARSAARRATAGSLRAEDYPQWDSPESVSEWVRNLRREDDARLDRKLGTSVE